MRYTFEATDRRGVGVSGTYEADNEAEVDEYLQKRKLIPVSIKPEAALLFGQEITLFEGITALDRIALVRNLAATARAGLGIIEALDILAQDASKKLLKKILLQIKTNMENGRSLWQSFQEYGRYFPPFFVGMIKAAESSGKLDTTLDELTQYLTREYNLVKKVKSALAYPLVLLSASFVVIVLLLGFVLPSLEKTFQRSQIVLPFYTKIMLAIGHAIRYNLILDIVVVVFIAGTAVLVRQNATLKNLFARLAFHLPGIKNILRKIVLVRFSRTLGSLLSSGALITDALRLTADSVGNYYYRQALLKVNEDVGRGISLSKALAARDQMFPHFLVSLVIVGEKTGTLESILKTFADFYDEEVDYSLRSLTTFLEPAMLLIMGLIVGSIVLSVILPIYQFVGKFI
ncbi:MAG TPA: type II secretion system F family protein [Candidatus Methylomirabilis sp.]|nr:type II secretion system F family protein [Candidatus Methylomirabilis sp.]